MTQERTIALKSGWTMLLAWVGYLVLGAALAGVSEEIGGGFDFVFGLTAVCVFAWSLILLPFGFFTLQPNEARVVVLFGTYKGTVRKEGFHWGNPFYSRDKTKISLRLRNLNGEQLKVNDKRGNPIEIAAVVVWKVNDTAEARFDVDDYEEYVTVQSESAVRHLASAYEYDHSEDGGPTLRSNIDEVSVALQDELQERLGKAGILVEEARLAHLAYAPEIASAMLRRQQAEAIIAARTKIVEGAVGMVDMALRQLGEKDLLRLDDEKQAALVSNLLVVLCGETEAQPVIHTGV